jgi:hypothetical protein
MTRRAGLAVLLAGFTTIAVATFRTAAASPAHLLAFHLSFLALFVLAARAPRSYAFTWLAGCLGLGFWLKMAAHTVLGYPYVEPVGAFAGGRAAWNGALDAATAAVLGVSFARVVQLWWTRAAAVDAAGPEPPPWYARVRRALWLASAFACVAIAVANTFAAFYQVGVNPRIALPFHLTVLPSWWLANGAPLWLALLLTWELKWSPPRHPAGRLSAVLVEMVIASASMLSRGAPIPRLGGYLLVIAERRAPLHARGVGPGPWVKLAAGAGAAFLAVLVLVSLQRIALYPPYTPPQVRTAEAAAPAVADRRPETAPTASTPTGITASMHVNPTVREVSGLFIDRWIGMEGVLAVVSSRGQGWPLMAAAFFEDPRRGTAGLYQHIARTRYSRHERFTFLTLAGPAAILRYSGSNVVVALGMAVLTVLLFLTEELARRLTRSELVTATAAVAAVHVLVQTTIVYLTAVFFLELWVTLGILGALSRRRGWTQR